HDPYEVARIKAAAAPGDRVQMKAFGLDGGAMAVDAGGAVHLETGVAGRARHRQAMGDEVPVLGHEVDHARRRSALAARRQAGVCGVRRLHPAAMTLNHLKLLAYQASASEQNPQTHNPTHRNFLAQTAWKYA